MELTVGLRFSVLHEGECIGNIFKIVAINESDASVRLYSEMLDSVLDKTMLITEIQKYIECGDISVL